MKTYIQNIVGGLCITLSPLTALGVTEGYKQLSYWSFELGTELHPDSIAPAFVVDNSQNGNALQLRLGAKVSELFSKDVPFQERGGKANNDIFFYHDGSYSLDGQPGGDCRRHVCVEYLYFNEDGTIQPIELTSSGVSGAPRK